MTLISQFDIYDFISAKCDFISPIVTYFIPQLGLRFHIREILHDATRLCTFSVEVQAMQLLMHPEGLLELLALRMSNSNSYAWLNKHH